MRAQPGVVTAVTAWLLAAGVIVGGSLLLGPKPDPLLAVLLAQGAVLLPVLVLALRLPLAELGLGPAAPARLAAGLAWAPIAVLISIGAGLVVMRLAGQPPAGQPVELAIQAIHERLGWGGLLLITAVLPGFLEEALFRGVILHGLRRRLPAWAAVALAALAFACLHLSPWRLLPQFCLGCLLGWMTLRAGSCWPAALAHAGHNALIIVIARLAPQPGA